MPGDAKLVFRVPSEWHRRVKVEAALRGMTITAIIRTAVDEWLERNPYQDQKESDTNGKNKETRGW